VFHEIAFFVAVVLAIPLIWTADEGKARVAAIAFSLSLVLCFGISALYHRPTWSRPVRLWLRRLDHAGIFLLIAGTYTPFGLLVLSRNWAIPVLAVVWTGALAAILLKVFWVEAPKWLAAAMALALGWAGVSAASQFLKLPVAALALVGAGGLFYTVGAFVYARRRPDWRPQTFGYHELFHVLTIAAAACQYAAIAFFVLPRG